MKKGVRKQKEQTKKGLRREEEINEEIFKIELLRARIAKLERK